MKILSKYMLRCCRNHDGGQMKAGNATAVRRRPKITGMWWREIHTVCDGHFDPVLEKLCCLPLIAPQRNREPLKAPNQEYQKSPPARQLKTKHRAAGRRESRWVTLLKQQGAPTRQLGGRCERLWAQHLHYFNICIGVEQNPSPGRWGVFPRGEQRRGKYACRAQQVDHLASGWH